MKKISKAEVQRLTNDPDDPATLDEERTWVNVECSNCGEPATIEHPAAETVAVPVEAVATLADGTTTSVVVYRELEADSTVFECNYCDAKVSLKIPGVTPVAEQREAAAVAARQEAGGSK